MCEIFCVYRCPPNGRPTGDRLGGGAWIKNLHFILFCGVLITIMAQDNRAPIVAVMGHIDHGKSSLLDYIRKTNTIAKEAGGITQHVSAYEVNCEYEGAQRSITFLDTPGHEAFHTLRARGASVADVAILVVAANDGFKPQTQDALTAITDAGIPYIVALTKIDKPDADVERAKASLLEHEIYLEGLGGSVPYVAISSKTGEGIPQLLDLVLLTADLAELTCDETLPATGFVLESMNDARRGTTATLVVKDGTLALHTFVVLGDTYAPVRFMENFVGERIQSAGPSTPVRIFGFASLPEAGTLFRTVQTKKEALALIKEHSDVRVGEAPAPARSAGAGAVLPLIIKADTTGSIEALIHEFSKVTHERVTIHVVASSVGSVTEGDVKTASATGGVIIAFTVLTDASAHDMADRLNVPIKSYNIIYEARECVEELLKERAPHIDIEEPIGELSIIRMFSSHARKHVLGARLISGVCSVNTPVHLLRRGVLLGEGKIINLQQARTNVSEIRTEGDCGLEVETRAEIAVGDTLVPYVIKHT